MSHCPSCQQEIQPDWYFCPNCAKALKEKVPEISVGKQILIYLVSFFLAPFGLGWGLKYVRSKNTRVRLIGTVAIILTAVSIFLMFTIFKSYVDQYSKMLNNFEMGKY